MKQRVKIILGVIFLCLLVFYSIFTFWEYLEGPRIEVFEPIHGYSTTSSTLELVGRAEHISYINLNDRQIFVDEEGNFSEVLLLPMGPSIIEVSGKDRYNRDIRKLITVVRLEETNQ